MMREKETTGRWESAGPVDTVQPHPLGRMEAGGNSGIFALDCIRQCLKMLLFAIVFPFISNQVRKMLTYHRKVE